MGAQAVMRKTPFLVLVVLTLLLSPKSIYAEDAVKKTGQSLVNLETNDMETRIHDLGRQVDEIERDKRFQDERIRNLERTVNDIRRLRS